MENKVNQAQNRVFGAIYSGIDVRDYQIARTAHSMEFPEEFSLRATPIKDQGDVGSCVAHALSSIVEYYNASQCGDTREMSTGYIYGNRNNSKHKGAGMVVRDALDALRHYGDVPKNDFPENIEVPSAIALFKKRAAKLYRTGRPNRISKYCRVKTVADAKAALYAGIPLVMAMDWYSDMTVINGVMTTQYSGYEGGHCMFIYGWDKRGWKIQNSWGESWGENGTFILPYDMDIAECWAVMDDIVGSLAVKKPFSSRIGNIVASIINAICNHNCKKK